MSFRLLTKPWPMVGDLLFSSGAHQSEFQGLGCGDYRVTETLA
jgi:hypothetical protein